MALAGAVVPNRVGAESASPLPEWEYSAGIAHLSYLNRNPPRWDVSIGLGLDGQPKYDGAGQYRVLANPILDVRFYDRAFLSTVEGVGVNLLHARTHRAGVAITYDFGRAHGVSAQTGQLHDVRPSPELKLFAEYIWFPAAIRVDLRRGIGGYAGWIGDLGGYLPLVSTDAFTFFAGPSLTFADGHYLQSYFGITGDESARSGYPEFHAAGGLKSVSLGLNANWYFLPHWFVDGVAAVDRLLGDAAGSPLTREKTQTTAGVTLGYEFQTPDGAAP